MTKLYAILVFALVLSGCGGGKIAPNNSTPTPTPTKSSAILTGNWAATFAGTNYVGTTSLQFNVVTDPATGNLVAGIAVYPPSADCFVGVPGLTVTLVGQNFSASGASVNSATNQPVTASISGIESTDNTTLSGNVSFSAPPCGTAVNPWTGSFVAQKR
jgi:hypothetical protein